MINKVPLLIAYAIIVVGALTMTAVLLRHGAPLKVSDAHKTGHAIKELELAPTSVKAKAIIDDWGKDLAVLALEDIRFDYAYIALYTVALALTGFYGAIVWGGMLGGWLARAGTIVGSAMFVAGIMDVFENLGMTAEIGGRCELAPLVFTVSAIKWIIVLASLAYSIPTVFMMLIRLRSLLQ